MNEWITHFANLGMTGATLALAVERKERSTFLQRKSDSQQGGMQNKINGTKNKTSKNQPMSVLEIMANPPPPPKGWNTFAGTMVIESTNR